MNREIKFRGKQIGTNTWIYGSFISYPDRSTYIAEYGSTIDELLSRCVHYNTVGQYTGLKDKNRKKIYEGDILSDNKTVFVTYFNQQQCSYWLSPIKILIEEDHEIICLNNQTLGNGYLIRKDLEIIGNVHENPEML